MTVQNAPPNPLIFQAMPELTKERLHEPLERTHMKLRDRYGWPVTHFRNRPFVNFIRYLLHTNVRQTWRLRNFVQQRATGGACVSCALPEGD